MNYRIWEIKYAGSPKIIWSQVKPTPEQLTVAAQLGVQLNPDDTFAIVGSKILECVGDAIGCPPRAVSDRQHELAEELEIDIPSCNSSWVAFVKIKEAIQLSNLAAVNQMELEPGDVVVSSPRYLPAYDELEGHVPEWLRAEHTVSSIGPDGQVFFKGGGQAPARYLSKTDSGV